MLQTLIFLVVKSILRGWIWLGPYHSIGKQDKGESSHFQWNEQTFAATINVSGVYILLF